MIALSLLVLASLGLMVVGEVPREWRAFAVAVVLIIAHTPIAEVFGRGGPFWWYHYERFRLVLLPYLWGLALFAGLTAILLALATWGFLYGSAFALGVLFGVWLADGSLSHGLLRALFPGPNPGLWTGLLYLIAAPIGLRMFDVTALGLVAGAAPFVTFHAVSFTLRFVRAHIAAMVAREVAEQLKGRAPQPV